MNVVVIVLSNYISSRNREMLTTTNERDTVIIIKQNKESSSLKALSLARSSAFLFFLSRSQSLVLSHKAQQCVYIKDTPKRFKSARKKTDVFPLFFSFLKV